MRMRTTARRLRNGFALLLTALLAGTLTTTSAVAAPGLRAADDGAQGLAQHWRDARTLDVTMRSPAVNSKATTRLLLPPGWTPNAKRTWPVVYLMPGCCGRDFRSWTEHSDVKRLVKNQNVIVAMPSGGVNGGFSNWWNYGDYGPPRWEDFHTQERPQILDRTYRAGTKRAIAGLSAGGYGAMAYASRHPGMYEAAASFSGLLNTLEPGAPLSVLYGNLRKKQSAFAMWGNEITQRHIWHQHNPYDHAKNLRGKRLFVSAGNGELGPYDPKPKNPVDATTAGAFEFGSYQNSLTFTTKLRLLGIPVTTDYYGPGQHRWKYWKRELHRAWPVLTKGW